MDLVKRIEVYNRQTNSDRLTSAQSRRHRKKANQIVKRVKAGLGRLADGHNA